MVMMMMMMMVEMLVTSRDGFSGFSHDVIVFPGREEKRRWSHKHTFNLVGSACEWLQLTYQIVSCPKSSSSSSPSA